MKISQIGELGLIKRIACQTKVDKSVLKGIGDDTAVLKYSPKEYLLFATDMLLEGVHFQSVSLCSRRSRFFYDIGWKALACNISDIVAMGGVPQYCLISVGLPADLELKFVDQLYKGIKEVAQQFGVNIVGGDTIKSTKVIINIALLGKVKKKNLVLRSGAKKGDAILVSGNLGGSISNKHLTFTLRLKEVQYLVNNFKIHSMIDISDGLILDLSRILAQSQKGAKIYLEKILVSAKIKNKKIAFKKALYGGENFELLWTVSKTAGQKISAQKMGHIIGEITDKRGILESSDGTKLKIDGYQHF